jgi:Na+/H+-dicarboxylate symporter
MLRGMTVWVLAAMLAGAAFGLACHAALDKDAIASLVNMLGLFSTIFLRAIRMIIAPLVFSTLLVGIGRVHETATVGRIALRAMIWFLLAGGVAMLVALAAVQVLEPGRGMHLALTVAGTAPVATPLTLATFVSHLVPASIIEAMANNEILQIVVFALVAGVAVAHLGAKGEPILNLADSVSHLMLKMTGYVMYIAPIAVFAAVGTVLAQQGTDIILRYAGYVGGYYVALAALWLIMLAAGLAILGGPQLKRILAAIRQPALVAYTTASSEAAYPALLANLETSGVPNRIASLVLPLGYSFNLIGSMAYCTWAALFLVQAYDTPMSGWAMAQLLFMLFVLSKGIAGVPRAGILTVAAVLPYFHVPEAGVVLILGMDQFMDMGRACTNVAANGLATASVARWEPK